MAMSSGDIRRVSRQDIQLVQNLIERCLQLYMNPKEVVQTLLTQAKIEPGFTELVWQKLEEQNRDFFKAYHIRLMLKNQIILFNQLLERQVQLMRESKPTGTSQTLQNGSSLNQTPFQYVSTSRADYTNGSVHPSNIINGGSLMHQGFQIAANIASFNSVRADIPTSAVPTEGPTMQMALVNGRKGISMKLEPNYLGTSDFPFCIDGTFLSEQQPQIDDANAASLSGGELSPDHINEPLVDNETFGFLSQIPRNVSFSDLADHFSLDVLEGFRKSPFCVSEPNNFSGSPRSECEG